MNDYTSLLKNWLIENNGFINYRSLEREINCPRGIIQKWVEYDMKIPEKWINPLYSLIENITKVQKTDDINKEMVGKINS